MDRRSFFKYSAAGVAAASLTGINLKALTPDPALPRRLSELLRTPRPERNCI